MGLFSSKKEVDVKTSVQPMIENHLIKNTMLDSSIKAILYSYDIPDTNAGNLMNSLGAKVNAGYGWAKDNYHWGLPQAKVISTVDASAQLTPIFNSLYGVGHTVTYYAFGDINGIHYGWRTLIASHGYNPATNRLGNLTTSKGTPVFLKNIIPVITQASYDYAVAEGVLDLYSVLGPAPNSGITITNPTGNPAAVGTPYVVDPVAVADVIKIEYEYSLLGVPTTESFNLTVLASNEGAGVHQARVVTSGGVVNYFSYIDGTGTYPTLDAILGFNTAEAGTFLPWLYLRYDFQNEARNGEKADAYDINGPINTAFMKSFVAKGKGTIPADVDQYKDAVKWCKYINLDFASMCKSINSNPDVEDVIQAFVNFSVDLNAVYGVEREYLYRYFTTLYFSESEGQEYGTVTSVSGNFSQLIQDKRSRMVFSFDSINRTLVTGVVAEVGKYHTVARGSYAKQISTTQYVVVTMANPRMSYHIKGKYSYGAVGTDEALRIPVDRSILRQMGLVQKEELLARAMVLVLNTYIETETPWYAQEWFRIVLIIIAVVVTILSIVFPPLAGVALVLWTIIYLVVYFIIMYVVMMVIQKAMEILIDALGLQNTFFAIAIMIVVAVVAMYYGQGDMAVTMIEQLTGAMLSALPTMLASGYQAAVDDMATELQDDMKDFSRIAEEQQKEMKAKMDEYGMNRNLIDGLEFVKKTPRIIWGESPELYYQRSVHSGNMAEVPYIAIRNYVKVALTPPDIKISLAEFEKSGSMEA